VSAYDPEDAVVEEVFINAPPERVFTALTDPKELLAWWGDPGAYWCTNWTLDLRVGGRWRCEGASQRGGAFHVEGPCTNPNSKSPAWSLTRLGEA
jgi:uncharacterized protein YndB with AHSA1/START domain